MTVSIAQLAAHPWIAPRAPPERVQLLAALGVPYPHRGVAAAADDLRTAAAAAGRAGLVAGWLAGWLRKAGDASQTLVLASPQPGLPLITAATAQAPVAPLGAAGAARPRRPHLAAVCAVDGAVYVAGVPPELLEHLAALEAVHAHGAVKRRRQNLAVEGVWGYGTACGHRVWAPSVTAYGKTVSTGVGVMQGAVLGAATSVAVSAAVVRVLLARTAAPVCRPWRG